MQFFFATLKFAICCFIYFENRLLMSLFMYLCISSTCLALTKTTQKNTPTVATANEHRGRGLATLLLAHAVDRMIADGVCLSYLHASLEGPRALYSKPENGYISLPMPKLKVLLLKSCGNSYYVHMHILSSYVFC